MSQAIEQVSGENWTVYLGDSTETSKGLPKNSIDFSVYSLPFANLYIYSDELADMGNCADYNEFFVQYGYLVREKLRITKPGRLSAVHCKDLPLYQNRDGQMGLYDFPGDIIREHEACHECGYDRRFAGFVCPHCGHNHPERWAFHSRVTIWKDPVTEMQRTKNHGLLHKNFESRAEGCRQGMADYLLVFRKWAQGGMPDNQVNQNRQPGDYIGEQPPEYFEDRRDYSIQVWQRYASPVWFDISQTNVLNFRQAREDKDEKHICPLQLDVIERAIDLWTNRGDVVYSPFGGIGSEPYTAVKMGRKAIAGELKKSYFDWMVKYLTELENEINSPTLFDLLEEVGEPIPTS